MSGGSIPRRGQWAIRAHLLLHIDGVGHDVDTLMHLHGDQAHTQDAWHVRTGHVITHATHLAQLLAHATQVLLAKQT